MLAGSRKLKRMGATDGPGTGTDLGLLRRQVAEVRREMRRRDQSKSGRGSPGAITRTRRHSPSGFGGPVLSGRSVNDSRAI
jgi:ribosome-interacting GTPase 1